MRIDAIRLWVFGRLVPAAFFAWLGYLQLWRVIADVRSLPSPVTAAAVLTGPLPAFLYLVFCTIPVCIYLGRPEPRARDGRMLPRALALFGTLSVLIVGALPQGAGLYTPAAWVRGLSAALTILAFAAIIAALLHLRRSLSVFPEARGMVTSGPYAVVRHPIYVAEVFATLAFVAVSPTVLTVAILLPFVTTQVLRSRFEERLLKRTFPLYAVYAACTPRLIPALHRSVRLGVS